MILKIKSSFTKDFNKLPKTTQEKVIRVLKEFEAVGSIRDFSGDILSLAGHSYVYRIRIGEYRIGLTFSGSEFLAQRILHRSQIYKKFP